MSSRESRGSRIEGVEAHPVGRALLKLALVVGLLILVFTGLAWAGGSLLASVLSASSSDGCSRITDRCTDLSLELIEQQTGYAFPDGSSVLDSEMEAGSFLDGADYRQLMATIRMPPGSSLPTSTDGLSSITVQRTEADGSVVVGVMTSNGKSVN